jgi:hypothetical protein
MLPFLDHERTTAIAMPSAQPPLIEFPDFDICHRPS